MKDLYSNKKALLSLLAIVMCFGFTAMSYGQAVVSVEPAEVESPAAGEQLTVNINIAGGADVAGYQVTVNFDPTALSYVSSANADYLPAGSFQVPAILTESSVEVSAAALAGFAAAADGTLATVTFEVIEAKASTIGLSDVIISNPGAEALDATTMDGMVTVAAAEEAPAEEAPAEDAAEEAPAEDAAADDAAEEAPAEDAAADDAAEEAPAEDTAADDAAEEAPAEDAAADDAAEEAPAEDDAADDAAEEAPAEDAAADDAAEEAPAEDAAEEAPAEEVVEEPALPEGPGFTVALEAGLNMISIPLMPAEPYTAKSLSEMLGATVVIQLDGTTQSFVGYTAANEDDGFGIEGGKGYIVNTPAGGMVKFTGEAWDNQPEVEEAPAEETVAEEEAPADDAADDAAEEAPAEDAAADDAAEEAPADDAAADDAAEEAPAEDAAADDAAEEAPADDAAEEVAEDAAEEAPAEDAAEEEVAEDAPAAPALANYQSAWAFIVSTDVQGMETGTAYTVVAENLRTGTLATQNITTTEKRASAVWADLNRKSVVEAGDRLEVSLYDDRGTLVSGPFQRTVTTGDIRDAFLNVEMRVGDVRPEDTVLAQNFPNPFNPETWIPYQLSEATEVKIDIYDVSGHLVRSLDLGWQPVGSYMTSSSAAYWDGKNAVGERVASGIYFYTLHTADFAATRRMVILK